MAQLRLREDRDDREVEAREVLRAPSIDAGDDPADYNLPVPVRGRGIVREVNVWERRWLVVKLSKLGLRRHQDIVDHLENEYGIQISTATVREDLRAVKALYTDMALEDIQAIRAETLVKLQVLAAEAQEQYNSAESQKDKQQWFSRALTVTKDIAEFAGVKQDVRLAIQADHDEEGGPRARVVAVGSF